MNRRIFNRMDDPNRAKPIQEKQPKFITFPEEKKKKRKCNFWYFPVRSLCTCNFPSN